MKKRLLPLLLTMALALTLLPAGAWAATGDIDYIDADGNTQTLTSGSYDTLEDTIDGNVLWNAAGTETGIKYVVIKGNATINGRLFAADDGVSKIHLILCDGATLTVRDCVYIGGGGGRLTIYGQSQGTGRLVVQNGHKDESSEYGILNVFAIEVCHNARLTINGGNVVANCQAYTNTAYSNPTSYGMHTITDSSVTINGGSLTVSGGNITSTKDGATGESCGIKCNGGAIKVNGGTLKATGGSVSMSGSGVTGKSCGISGSLEVGSPANKNTAVTAERGTVTITGTGNREEWDIDGSLNISGGEVKGKDAQGVLMKGDLNASGGTLKLREGSLPKVQSGTTIDPASLLPEGYAYHDTDGNPVPLGDVRSMAGLSVKPCAHKKQNGTLLSINGVCPACRHVCPHPDGYTDGLCSICGAAAPVTGGNTTLRYTGGNSFATSRAQTPLSVEIDGTPVAFVGDGSSFTVSCLDPGARWVTVRWQGASVTASFTPDANARCTEIAIPKTGDMPLWAAVAEWLGL